MQAGLVAFRRSRALSFNLEMVNPFKLTKEEEAMMRMDWVKPAKKTKKNKSVKQTKGERRYKQKG